MIAQIAVSAAVYAIDKPYSYRVPAGLRVAPGMRVTVPFGRGNRMTEGVVLALTQGSEAELKCIDHVLDADPVLDDDMLRLAAFVRERYFCTFYDAIRAVLPAGLWFQMRDTVSLAPETPWQGQTIRQQDAVSVIHLLQELGGSAEVSVLRQAIPDPARLEAALRYLIRKKWVKTQTDFLRRAGDKTERIAVLAASAEEAMEYAGRKARSAAVGEALTLLCRLGRCSVKELCYFTGASTASIRRLEKLGYLKTEEQPVLRCREIRPAEREGPLVLNREQQEVFRQLEAQRQRKEPGVALLYGVTGSGKTAVYLKLMESVCQTGKSALFLVPEIALTPQLLRVFASHFGSRVAVLHSSLPAGERYDQWKRIRSGQAQVVVGTRSAVFAPCRPLGLIVLDEEQEHSYQSENTPRYCAREVAIYRGAKEGALVLLGSATPSVESMYRAKTGAYTLYRLQNRYNGRPLPQVELVDMKEEIRAGNDSALSRPMQQAMERAMARREQTILLLNRRGASRMMQCPSCGQVPSCPRCSVHLTYHSANHRLMCHYCGFSQPAPTNCPQCGGLLKQVGSGTQSVQAQLEERFPAATVARMDADTVSASNPHEKILERFETDNQQVLVGTQMVAKGLNLKNVTLVGVLDADFSLYMDSYRAAETTFNMLTQVVGRAGRGEKPGMAMIQTMTPEHPVLLQAARQDYDSFYAQEIQLRRAKGCPPFCDFYTVTFSGPEEPRVLRGATAFRDSLQASLSGNFQLLGPAPAVIARINYNYRYRLTLRCQGSRALRQTLAYVLREFQKDYTNRGVAVFVDTNGFD